MNFNKSTRSTLINDVTIVSTLTYKMHNQLIHYLKFCFSYMENQNKFKILNNVDFLIVMRHLTIFEKYQWNKLLVR